MSVLIKGMEMPKDGDFIVIRPDGKAYYVSANPQNAYEGGAISVPSHGRLGDLDALSQLFKEKATEHGGIGGIMVAMAAGCIDAAPTIIEAEEDK